MHAAHNINLISNSLCSLGAHLGHFKVDAYQSLSYYVLGNRNSFIIIDIDKAIPMLKAAILFIEQMVRNYGHVVFCHSNIVHFSLQLNNYVSRVVNARNQSFSYWKWVPGCITNYRYVFLRLVELLFSELNGNDDTGASNTRLVKAYNKSFLSYYKRLWFWFIGELDLPVGKLSSKQLARIKAKFHFFLCVVNKYCWINI